VCVGGCDAAQAGCGSGATSPPVFGQPVSKQDQRLGVAFGREEAEDVGNWNSLVIDAASGI